MSEKIKLKSKVWRKFSEYIRLKECLETTATKERGICCTCGQIKPFTELDAGHFISGRSNAVLFDELGVHIQCQRCNRFMEGNKVNYYQYMLKRYGQDTIDRMQALKYMTRSLSILELLGLYEHYKQQVKKLKSGG